MTAEQQLERSVLERKEREELQAIAQAMSLKTTNAGARRPTSSTRSCEAAGVEVSRGARRPRRRRHGPATGRHGRRAAPPTATPSHELDGGRRQRRPAPGQPSADGDAPVDRDVAVRRAGARRIRGRRGPAAIRRRRPATSDRSLGASQPELADGADAGRPGRTGGQSQTARAEPEPPAQPGPGPATPTSPAIAGDGDVGNRRSRRRRWP